MDQSTWVLHSISVGHSVVQLDRNNIWARHPFWWNVLVRIFETSSCTTISKFGLNRISLERVTDKGTGIIANVKNRFFLQWIYYMCKYWFACWSERSAYAMKHLTIVATINTVMYLIIFFVFFPKELLTTALKFCMQTYIDPKKWEILVGQLVGVECVRYGEARNPLAYAILFK